MSNSPFLPPYDTQGGSGGGGDDPWGGEHSRGRRGQSRFGILGIVCFVLAVMGIVGLMIAAAMMVGPTEYDPAMTAEDPDPEHVFMGIAILLAGLLNLLGLILSLLGFAESSRGKATAWIGLILNALPCLGCSALFAFGCIFGMVMAG